MRAALGGCPHVERQASVLVGVRDPHAGHDLAERAVERLRRGRTEGVVGAGGVEGNLLR